MELISTFDINKEALLDLLRGIQQGKVQLPDFSEISSGMHSEYPVCCAVSPLPILLAQLPPSNWVILNFASNLACYPESVPNQPSLLASSSSTDNNASRAFIKLCFPNNPLLPKIGVDKN